MEKREYIVRIEKDSPDRHCPWYEEHSITEKEIVKPYLEKLYESIINHKWGDSNGDFMTGVAAVSNMIYDIIEMIGKEQEC